MGFLITLYVHTYIQKFSSTMPNTVTYNRASGVLPQFLFLSSERLRQHPTSFGKSERERERERIPWYCFFFQYFVSYSIPTSHSVLLQSSLERRPHVFRSSIRKLLSLSSVWKKENNCERTIDNTESTRTVKEASCFRPSMHQPSM